MSGIVALMLEVNPDLEWRDVMEILILSSSVNDPDHKSWTPTKGIGNRWYSYMYLFEESRIYENTPIWCKIYVNRLYAIKMRLIGIIELTP